jgi:hypothetical protein
MKVVMGEPAAVAALTPSVQVANVVAAGFAVCSVRALAVPTTRARARRAIVARVVAMLAGC